MPAPKVVGKDAVKMALEMSFDGLRKKHQWRTKEWILEKKLMRRPLPFIAGDRVLLIHGPHSGKYASIKSLDAEKKTAQIEAISTTHELRPQETNKSETANTAEFPIDFMKIIDPVDKLPTDVQFDHKRQRISLRTKAPIPKPEKPLSQEELKAQSVKEPGPYDTLTPYALEKTFELNDPWNFPFPISLQR